MDLIGKTLGQYRIVEAVGHGGMADVYKAQQPALDRFVAVKVLLPQQANRAEFRERFNREAKAVAQLNHPNILPIMDYGQDDDLSYIVMKYVSGGTLADRLKHPIDLVTTANLITQIAAALDHAHDHGILHRDIKPSNVLLDEGEWVQLADFGLAKLLHGNQSLTISGLAMGTPAYLSPEQGQGLPLDRHSDIYSLGAILYEMVTGRLPFTAETAMGVIVKHIYDQPPPPRILNPALPEAVEAVVLKALAKNITERYRSAGELANALQGAVAVAPIMQFAPVQGIDSNATPHFSPQAGPPTPVVVSNQILFEETAPAVPNFVGRTAELAAYRARLERDQLVIITGMAGVGKTTLGARLARDTAAAPEHIFWFTFDSVEKSTTDALYWALASFLDNRGEPSLGKYLRGEVGAQKPLEQMAKLNLLMAALATGQYVLCFDDFQIVKDVPEIGYVFKVIRQRFVELKQTLPARIIIMGRAVPTEMEYLAAQALSGLAEDDLSAFLSDRGVTLSPVLRHQLWEHTEGNPKLLELAAGALAGLPDSAAENFIASLVRRGDIRDYLMTNIYSALTIDEQRVMSALAVFPGPIERASVEEILVEEGVSNLAQRLDTLANKHVLTVDEEDQIDCHDLVREYCYHVLSRRERDRFHQRAAGYFEAEQNWLAAAHHHFERRDPARSLDLLIAHADDIINSGGAAALSQQLSRFNVATLTPEQQLALHKTQGYSLRIRGEYQQAIAVYHAAFDEAIKDEDRAEVLWLIARTYLKLGDYEQTLDYCNRSLKLSKQSVGNQVGIARAHHDLGWVYFRFGKQEQARQHFSVCRQIAESKQEQLIMAQADLGLGSVAWKNNQPEEARQRFEDCRRIFREHGDRVNEAGALGNLGLIYGAMGEVARQLSYYQQAFEIQQQIGDVDGQRFILNNLGYLYYAVGDYAQAFGFYQQLAQLVKKLGQKPMLSVAYAGLADTLLAQSKSKEALEYAVQAQQLALDTNSRFEYGLSHRVLGDIWLALNDPIQAKACFEKGIPILEQYQESEELAKARTGYQTALSQLGSNSIQ